MFMNNNKIISSVDDMNAKIANGQYFSTENGENIWKSVGSAERIVRYLFSWAGVDSTQKKCQEKTRLAFHEGVITNSNYISEELKTQLKEKTLQKKDANDLNDSEREIYILGTFLLREEQGNVEKVVPSLRREIHDLQQQSLQNNQGVQQSIQEKRQLEAEIANLKAQKDHLQNENGELNKQKVELNKQKDDLSNFNRELTNRNAALKEQINIDERNLVLVKQSIEKENPNLAYQMLTNQINDTRRETDLLIQENEKWCKFAHEHLAILKVNLASYKVYKEYDDDENMKEIQVETKKFVSELNRFLIHTPTLENNIFLQKEKINLLPEGSRESLLRQLADDSSTLQNMKNHVEQGIQSAQVVINENLG